MLSVRNILIGLAIAFTAYLAARGLAWTRPVPQPILFVAALALYLVTTWLCIFVVPGTVWRPRRVREGVDPATLPAWAGALALATALVVPSAVALAVGPAARTQVFATWYIGGIGALMTIVMVRQRSWTAWAGTVLLAVGCMAWMGPLPALALGLVGSLVWVVVAQLVVLSLQRAAMDAARLAELQQAASAWQASQAVRQRERRMRVQNALAVAGPVLGRVVLLGGQLDDEARTEARLAEGRLRDELRGARLLDDDVREALQAARLGGASVTVLDEGGLDDVDEAALAVIRSELAETVRGARSRRLYIRTAPHDRIAVTVVGRQDAAGGLSDDDSVDLWREIPYPGREDRPDRDRGSDA